MIKSKYQNKLSLLLLTGVLFAACKKMVTVPLSQNLVTTEQVFENDATATSAVVAIYGEMMNSPSLFSAGGTTLLTGLSADELYYYSTSFRDEFQKNDITPGSHSTIETGFWTPAYRFIYTANSCIEGIERSAGITPDTKKQLLGEVKFLRAFVYFYLVNLFGDVPLITSTDYRINAYLPRSSADKVYMQISLDLTDAINLLPDIYTASDRIRPNRSAAQALLARVHLYRSEWQEALDLSSAVITSNNYLLNTNLNQVFLKSSKETIWQLQPVNPTLNTYEANQVLPATTTSAPTFLFTPQFINSFAAGDIRKSSWIGSRTYAGQTLYYPSKYKVYGNSAPVTENYIALRLAEMYLIRAEARTRLNDYAGALNDINTIRNRAGLISSTVNSLQGLLAEIEAQKKFELFAEWGHRWFDLKRTNRTDSILGNLKPTSWQSTDALWPIPNNQLLANPSLTQNPGY